MYLFGCLVDLFTFVFEFGCLVFIYLLFGLLLWVNCRWFDCFCFVICVLFDCLGLI